MLQTRWKRFALAGVLPLAVALPLPASAAPIDLGGADRPVAADDSYYEPALGKTGPELKAALNDIISTNDQLTYDEVWDALKVTDQDPANPDNVILLYSGRSQGKDTNLSLIHI